MMIIFQKGDDFLETLAGELRERKVASAFFSGLGSFLEADLAYYDLDKKKYLTKKFAKGPYEVLSIIGNVAGDVIHCHVALGTKRFRAFGGHLVRATVGGTLELNVVQLEEQLQRSHDEETGLNLLR